MNVRNIRLNKVGVALSCALSLSLGSGAVLAAGAPRGIVYVAPGTQSLAVPGRAVELLRQRFRLKNLHNSTPIQKFPRNARGIVLSAEDLTDPALAQFAKKAYAAGLTVGMVEANTENAESLRQLVGRDYPIMLEDEGSPAVTVPLVAIREDGAESCCQNKRLRRTHILGKQPSPADAKLKALKLADQRKAEWLKAVFDKWPEKAGPSGDSPSSDLTDLANSTLTDTIQANSEGTVLQVSNQTWAARSFVSQVDYFYVKQWATVQNPILPIFVEQVISENDWVSPTANPVTVQFAPATTQTATTYSAGVGFSIGGTAGYNKGGIATVNSGLSITNSTSTTVPPVYIAYEGDLPTGKTKWEYETSNGFDGKLWGKTLAYTQNWIWAVPLASYTSSDPITFSTSASVNLAGLGPGARPVTFEPVQFTLSNPVPQPFNHIQLAPPTVASVSTSTAKPGDVITVTGSNFYLISGVLIGGISVPATNYEVVESNTKLKIVIPGNQLTGDNQSIVINTQEGLSNSNITISIQ